MAMETLALFTGALDRDVVRDIIFVREANETPIYSWLAGMGPGQAMANKIEWYTEGFDSRRTQINNGGSAYTSSTTSLVVDSGAAFYPNCLIYAVATGEIMLCTEVSTNTITVVRGLGSIVAAHANSVADDAYLLNLGSASGEGASAPAARITDRVQNVTYLQTFRHTVEQSGKMNRVKYLTGDNREKRRLKKFREHMRDWEHALILGVADESSTDANSKIVSTMGGFFQHVTTNVSNIGGAMSKAEWDAFAEKAFAQGSGEKTMFAGKTLLSAIHTLEGTKVRYAENTRVVGLTVEQVLTAFGVLNLVYDRRFGTDLAGAGIVIDAEDVELLYSDGGEPHLRENIQDPDVDGTIDEWFSEGCVRWGDEANHAVIKGVTGAE